MRLFEHDEFEQAILQAARRLGVSEQFVEKDYYVTEILRIVVEQLDGKAVFKGGTSLSKGWRLINRFSEDIDLFVNRDMFEPRPGGNKMDRILKELGVGHVSSLPGGPTRTVRSDDPDERPAITQDGDSRLRTRSGSGVGRVGR